MRAWRFRDGKTLTARQRVRTVARRLAMRFGYPITPTASDQRGGGIHAPPELAATRRYVQPRLLADGSIVVPHSAALEALFAELGVTVPVPEDVPDEDVAGAVDEPDEPDPAS